MKSRIDYEKCRALRAKGWTLTTLAVRYGVTRQRMQQVCKGVECPIMHRPNGLKEARQAQSRESRRRAKAAVDLLARGYAPKVIAGHLGVAQSTIYNYLPLLHSPDGKRHYRPCSTVAQPCA